jgi:hypothetical protein
MVNRGLGVCLTVHGGSPQTRTIQDSSPCPVRAEQTRTIYTPARFTHSLTNGATIMYDGTVTTRDPDLVETYELDDGRTAYLLYDRDTPNPRGDYDHASVMVQCSSGYLDIDDAGQVGDGIAHWCGTGDYVRHRDCDALVERYARMFCDVAAFTRWDGRADRSDGSWGYAWLTRETVQREGITDPATYLDGEVAEYAAWAAGECYGVIVNDADGEEVDSLWGLIGDDYAVKVAESGLDGFV